MQFVVNMVSICAFLLSLYNFIVEKAKSKKRLSISLDHVFSLNSYNAVHLSIYNKSTSSICISSIHYSCNGQDGRLGEYRRLIIKDINREYSDTPTIQTWTSRSLPIKIEPGDVFSGILVSSEESPALSPETPILFKLNTSKGPWKRKCSFTGFCDVKLMSRCQVPD